MNLIVEFRYDSIFKGSSSKRYILSRHSGGLEMLFDNEMKHQIRIPKKTSEGSAVTIAFLINYLWEHLMRDSRKELFVLDGSM